MKKHRKNKSPTPAERRQSLDAFVLTADDNPAAPAWLTPARTSPRTWTEACDTFPTATARAEWLCLAVAPDLRGRPFYCVDANQCRDRLALDPGTSLSSPLLDLNLRSHLEAAGRWQGRGTAILVDRSDALFFAIVLHELAHAVENLRTPGEVVPLLEVDPAATERVLAILAAEPISYTERSDVPQWFKHGREFIRLCLHLHHRAELLGLRQNVGSLQVAGARYGLSHAIRYQRELCGEIADFDPERPLTELRGIEPPAGFVELFAQDTQTQAA